MSSIRERLAVAAGKENEEKKEKEKEKNSNSSIKDRLAVAAGKDIDNSVNASGKQGVSSASSTRESSAFAERQGLANEKREDTGDIINTAIGKVQLSYKATKNK